MRLFSRRRNEQTYEPDDADLVWNRATDGGGDAPLAGDRALASLLTLHGLTMNGGLLHAVEVLTESEVRFAEGALRFFDLSSAADVVQWAHNELQALDDDDIDAVELLEAEADRRYYVAVADGAVVERHFRSEFEAHPEAFAPLGGQ